MSSLINGNQQPSKRMLDESYYNELANKLGISVATAKKHEEILAKVPRILSKKLDPSKPSVQLNPVYRLKNKLSLKRLQKNVKRVVEPKCIIANDSDEVDEKFFDIKIKEEPGIDEPEENASKTIKKNKVTRSKKQSGKPAQTITISKRASNNVAMYLDSIGTQIKQEIVSPEHSPSFNYSLTSSKKEMPSFENKIIKLESFSGSSGDDFASPMPESFKRKNKTSQQIKVNPFSTVKNKQTLKSGKPVAVKSSKLCKTGLSVKKSESLKKTKKKSVTTATTTTTDAKTKKGVSNGLKNDLESSGTSMKKSSSDLSKSELSFQKMAKNNELLFEHLRTTKSISNSKNKCASVQSNNDWSSTSILSQFVQRPKFIDADSSKISKTNTSLDSNNKEKKLLPFGCIDLDASTNKKTKPVIKSMNQCSYDMEIFSKRIPKKLSTSTPKNIENQRENLEESFAEICKDINNAASNEKITLYRGDSIRDQPPTPETPNSSLTRDPRLNKTISPINTSRDPRLNRSISPLKSPAISLILNDTLSPETVTPESNSTTDPRLRKRKINEETSQPTKMIKVAATEKETTLAEIQVNNQSTTPRKISVHDRLGPRSAPSSPDPNDSKLQRRKSISYNSDDDGISLHPDDLDLFDEETTPTSPRHRKFESERISIDEEMAFTPAVNFKNRWQNKNQENISNFRKPQNFSAKLSAELASRLGNRKSQTGNNTVFEMNERQRKEDEANFQEEQSKNKYVFFGNNDFNEVSASFNIHSNNKPSTGVNFNHQRTTFFRGYCYSTLKEGQCKVSACIYNHSITILYKLIKLKTPDLLFLIIDNAIFQCFNFFLLNIWEIILPLVKGECFVAFRKYYNFNRNMITERTIKMMLDHCLNEKLHDIDSFLKKISEFVNEKDEKIIGLICTVAKSYLRDGFCWESIKCLCKQTLPPRDMIELSVLQCLKRKKNFNHLKEVHDLINKMTEAEKSKLSPNMLIQFDQMIQERSAAAVTSKEGLSTLPLKKKRITFNKPSVQEPTKVIENQQSKEALIKFSNNFHQPCNSPLRTGAAPNTGENINIQYKVETLDVDSQGKPGSAWQQRFWKLYTIVNSVNEGLAHLDYNYVWKQMMELGCQVMDDKELLKRAFYQILCSDVLASEHHVAGVIKAAGNCEHDIINYLRSKTTPQSIQL